MQSIVSDATTLIILGKLDRYDLLENIFSKIFVPKKVINEISKKLDGVYELIIKHKLFESKIITDISLYSTLDGILDDGEREAIVLAKELDLILLIDEKKGRKIAQNMGIEVIGLLGILILNIKKDKISKNEAIKILDEVREIKFRVSHRLVESFTNIIDKL